ncbi:hypothetical protein B0A50_05946 [Salinomyces thailandicus]|uniref:Uncharacterized protein n=1 Tax=Salinomyces thailandicus TaxID=706561 RepID=A0A4U0TSV8_9PEZI|nr:hypothetical protein B0A50_05946 [Salinomyces thailandica]
MSIPCPGKELGCRHKSKRSAAEAHVNKCTYAKMAPLWLDLRQKMTEQEAAQKIMTRKLEVLETGFQTMQDIISQRNEDPDRTGANESNIHLLDAMREHGRRRRGRQSSTDTTDTSLTATVLDFPSPPISRPTSNTTFQRPTSQRSSLPLSRYAPSFEPSPPEPIDFDLTSPFPPPTTNNGPFADPLHHLLSMHENLRDEMSRVASALQELDGRQSMQALNENLRTREEISYLGAQVAGLSRQVHWLTSAQLQRMSRAGTPGTGGGGGGAGEVVGNGAGSGVGVEAAVSGAASALRGAARLVDVSGSGSAAQGGRRNRSEEGRTKL